MADRKTLGIVEDDNLFICDLNENPLPNLIFKDDIAQWNAHDYKNVIAFKDYESFFNWTCAVKGLVKFYVNMGQMSRDACFNIFFKSYTIDNINDLKEDSCKFIRENYWDDILEFANKGYYIIYFTTQRECHDKNHFITYMIDNWMHDRVMCGHKCAEEDEIKNIEFIVLNEK